MAESEVSDVRRRIAGAATLNTYKLGSLAARLMPGPLAAGASASIGLGASFASPARRRMVERHLRRVNPAMRGNALRVAVQQAFDYYARYYVESFRLPTMSNAAVARPFTIEGWQQVLDGLQAGNGVILALPHLGGWEWAGRWMTDQGFKMTVVVEALDPPELFEWFADLRQELGMTVVPTGPKAGRRCSRRCEPTRRCACCATATSTAPVSMSSSSENTPRCRPARPPCRSEPGHRCCRSAATSPRSTTATTLSSGLPCRRSAAAACAKTSAE